MGDRIKDKDKTKKQLVDELSELRTRIRELEKEETDFDITELKKTNLELKESKERFRSIVKKCDGSAKFGPHLIFLKRYFETKGDHLP